jgi:hypothetical protein
MNKSKSKSKKEASIPDWASEMAFTVTDNEDILENFYAPNVEKKEEPKQIGRNEESTNQDTKSPTAATVEKKVKTRNLLGKKNINAKKLAGNLETNTTQTANPKQIVNTSIPELLPGKALDLYLMLYEETLGANPPRAAIRMTKNDLRLKSGITNPKTLNTHEKYLMASKLISRKTRAGDHTGSVYQVTPLDEIGVDDETLAEFDEIRDSRRQLK